MALLSVNVGSRTIVPEHPVAIVGDANAYRLITSDVFTATAAELAVSFTKRAIGDATALIDDVRIFAVTSLELGIRLQHDNAPAIRIDGSPGELVTLEFKNALEPATAWQFLTNLVLGSGSETVIDHEAPFSNPRFYRAQHPLTR